MVYGNKFAPYILDNKNICFENFIFDEVPDIPPEEIEQLQIDLSECVEFLEEGFFQDYLKYGHQQLKLLGDSTKYIAQSAKKIVDIIKAFGITKEGRARISKEFSTCFMNVANSYNFIGLDSLKFKGYDSNKIARAFTLVVYASTINTLFLAISMLLFGPKIGPILTNVICAPIVEEGAKVVSIKGKFDVEFAVVFNAYEFASYVQRAPLFNLPYKKVAIIRIFPIIMHLVTTTIHKITGKTPENDPKTKKDTTLIGYIIGVLIHFAWNFMSVFENSFFNKAIKKISGI